MKRNSILSLLMLAFLSTTMFTTIALGQTGEGEKAVTQNTVKDVLNIKSIEEVTTEQVETVKKLVDIIVEFFVKYSFQVIGGIIVLILGWWIGGFIASKILVFLQKKNLDITVSKFIAGTMKLLVMMFAVIVALGKFGIEIAPLIAGISVAGFGLSFALQGPLSNYAAGISLIFAKPFKVGDIIEVAEQIGEVIEIKIPRTELKTVDGTMIMIPNNQIVGQIIENFSSWKKIAVSVGVAYEADVQKSIDLIRDVIKKDARVNTEKEAKIGVEEFGDSSINLVARFFVKQDDYRSVLHDVNKGIFDAFKQNGIVIPFPQRDVHLFQEKG